MTDRGSQQQLAQFVASSASDWTNARAQHIARQSLLDTTAVTFAGINEPVVALVDNITPATQVDTRATAWLTGKRYVPESAALVNAVAAHALDYDDVTPAWRGHPGAVLWPALFASASLGDVDLDELLTAFVIGFEVGAQLGRNMADHYLTGWHATATVGVIAATAACCRLLNLDAARSSHAFGLAVAQASGVQANFGSMAKPMQAGFAAAAAVRSTLFARGGVEASAETLDGPSGFSMIYGNKPRLELDLNSSSGPAIVSAGIEVKQFPMCYAAHRAVAAALAARAQLNGELDRLIRIEIAGSPGAHKPLLQRQPSTIEEARFSVEFGVACALIDGSVRLASFTPASLERSAVVRCMSISHVSETCSDRNGRTASLGLHLDDGTRIDQSVSDLGGLSDANFVRRLRDKVADCLSAANVAAFADAVSDAILSGPADIPVHSWQAAVFDPIHEARASASERGSEYG